MSVCKDMYELPTPAVAIDLDMVEHNIDKMVQDAAKYGIKHRPHVKTHRCSYLANMQIEHGCSGITVAKLGEAEVMADNGIKDIFVAYPIIGKDKLARLIELSKRVKVSTIINSLKGAKELSEAFEKEKSKIDVLIELDGGLNRGGLKPGEPCVEFAKKVKDLKGLNIIGIMYYGGLIYNCHNRDEIAKMAAEGRDTILKTANELESIGLKMEVLSAGSSFSGKTPEALEGVTEIRSGHYIFNDCGQLDIGLVGPQECALTVISTVISKPDEYTVIADVGTKSLTSDGCHYKSGYGYIVGHPEIEIYLLNEEHAFLKSKEPIALDVGDKIAIIPNHACVVTNLTEKAYGFRDGKLDRMLTIDARAKSV